MSALHPLRRGFARGNRRSAQYRHHGTSAALAAELGHTEPPPPSTQTPPPPPPRSLPTTHRTQTPPVSSVLTDTFSRQHTYLRLSLTERCNLRCTYCMPAAGVPLGPASHQLTTPELEYLSSLFVRQGVNKIRLTGGEPTVRADIIPLMQRIGRLRAQGLRELAITTNGLALARKLDAMVDAGLTGVNVSLDTLEPGLFMVLTRRQGWERVWASMERVLEMNRRGAGVRLKVNCVVMRGVNDAELVKFVELGREKDLEVRFIEYMPFDGNKWERKKMVSYEEMVRRIREVHPTLRQVRGEKNDTSKTWEVPGFAGRVGFITSMTHNFCGSCNRLRITSDGNLKVCLFGNTEVSLRDMIRARNGGLPLDDEALEAWREAEMNRRQGLVTGQLDDGWASRETELLDIIDLAVKRKKKQHAGMGQLENMPNRPMILIGDTRRANRPAPPFALMGITRASRPRHPRIPYHLLSRQPGGFTHARHLSTTRTQRSHDAEKPSKLSHLTPQGQVNMVDVSEKAPTTRIAVACGSVILSNPEIIPTLDSEKMAKGNVLTVAQIAGIQAAKRCWDLIPLCHQIALSKVLVELEVVPGKRSDVSDDPQAKSKDRIDIIAVVKTVAGTGVEMEAMTAVMGAALTIVDMCKAMDKSLTIQGVRVLYKSGGKTGTYHSHVERHARAMGDLVRRGIVPRD